MYIRVSTASERYAIGARTLRAWARSGRLEHIRLPDSGQVRISEESLLRLTAPLDSDQRVNRVLASLSR